jgi:hypothetical protein
MLEKYAPSTNIINELNKMRDFWHVNSVETDKLLNFGKFCRSGNPILIKVNPRQWNSEEIKQEFFKKFDNFLGDLLDHSSPEEIISIMHLTVAPDKNYNLNWAIDMTKLQNWERLIDATMPTIKHCCNY